jgi:hypothetical protein
MNEEEKEAFKKCVEILIPLQIWSKNAVFNALKYFIDRDI